MRYRSQQMPHLFSRFHFPHRPGLSRQAAQQKEPVFFSPFKVNHQKVPVAFMCVPVFNNVALSAGTKAMPACGHAFARQYMNILGNIAVLTHLQYCDRLKLTSEYIHFLPVLHQSGVHLGIEFVCNKDSFILNHTQTLRSITFKSFSL